MSVKKLDWVPLVLARGVMGVRSIQLGWAKLSGLLHPAAGHYGVALLAILEIAAGACVILGLRTRAAASVLLAIFIMHGWAHAGTSHEALFSFLTPVTVLLMLVIQGPGLMAMDR